MNQPPVETQASFEGICARYRHGPLECVRERLRYELGLLKEGEQFGDYVRHIQALVQVYVEKEQERAA